MNCARSASTSARRRSLDCSRRWAIRCASTTRSSPGPRIRGATTSFDTSPNCASVAPPTTSRFISVDTKKKELVGTFRNPGAKWDRSPEPVNDHDFRSDAEGLAIPYGIYDPRANAGTVFVGQTADTPAFAVDCIEKWWPRWTGQIRPLVDTAKPAISGVPRRHVSSTSWARVRARI